MIGFQILILSYQLLESWDNSFSSNKFFSSMIGLFSTELIPLAILSGPSNLLGKIVTFNVFSGGQIFWNKLVFLSLSLTGVSMHLLSNMYDISAKYLSALLMISLSWKIWVTTFSGIFPSDHIFTPKRLESEILLKRIESSMYFIDYHWYVNALVAVGRIIIFFSVSFSLLWFNTLTVRI